MMSVPAATIVPWLYVFVPESLSVPAFSFSSEYGPLIAPETFNCPAPAMYHMPFAPRMTGCEIVCVPDAPGERVR